MQIISRTHLRSFIQHTQKKMDVSYVSVPMSGLQLPLLLLWFAQWVLIQRFSSWSSHCGHDPLQWHFNWSPWKAWGWRLKCFQINLGRVEQRPGALIKQTQGKGIVMLTAGWQCPPTGSISPGHFVLLKCCQSICVGPPEGHSLCQGLGIWT